MHMPAFLEATCRTKRGQRGRFGGKDSAFAGTCFPAPSGVGNLARFKDFLEFHNFPESLESRWEKAEKI